MNRTARSAPHASRATTASVATMDPIENAVGLVIGAAFTEATEGPGKGKPDCVECAAPEAKAPPVTAGGRGVVGVEQTAPVSEPFGARGLGTGGPWEGSGYGSIQPAIVSHAGRTLDNQRH